MAEAGRRKTITVANNRPPGASCRSETRPESRIHGTRTASAVSKTSAEAACQKVAGGISLTNLLSSGTMTIASANIRTTASHRHAERSFVCGRGSIQVAAYALVSARERLVADARTIRAPTTPKAAVFVEWKAS